MIAAVRTFNMGFSSQLLTTACNPPLTPVHDGATIRPRERRTKNEERRTGRALSAACEEAVMRLFRVPLILVAVVTIGAASGQGQGKPSGGEGASAAGYKLVEFPTPMASAAGFPAPWNLIQASSVAVTSKGTVLVLHRGAHPILEFDTSGKLLRSWGDGMISEGKVAAIPQANWAPTRSHYSAVYGPAGCTSCGAHSVRVDPQGNIWVIDATGHVIYKMNQEGKELMRLGTKGAVGADASHFNLPTDVAFAANGDLYVTDGYGGARVVKFSKDGKFLLEWGKRGTGPGEFGLPHNVVVDAKGRVYVTDRDNQRIQIFDANGKYMTEWKNTGGISGLAMTKDGRIITGGVVRDLNGTVVTKLPDAQSAHGAAIDAAGNIYLAQLSGIVQKYVKQ
jgi:streptogramin lyase